MDISVTPEYNCAKLSNKAEMQKDLKWFDFLMFLILPGTTQLFKKFTEP